MRWFGLVLLFLCSGVFASQIGTHSNFSNQNTRNSNNSLNADMDKKTKNALKVFKDVKSDKFLKDASKDEFFSDVGQDSTSKTFKIGPDAPDAEDN